MNPSPPTAGEVAEAALRLRTAEERSDYITATCEGLPALLAGVEGLLARHMKQPADDEVGANSTLLLPHQETMGETIGRYRLLQRLGEGGFGVVWEAEQREPVRRRVALKIIKLGMDTHEVIARFEAERQALALMDHPNIARVLDGGATDTGRPYFVMELVNGMPLTQYCDTNKLSLRERLELFIPICQAVQHAHQKGIIHRDLKPTNILVSTVDGKPLPKVIDFGIARATSQQLTDKTLFTQVGQLIGTPEYMSPEQTGLDGQDVDTRTDIYALGVVLYELLTGRTPLDRERLKRAAHAEIQRIVCEEEPPRPSTKLTTLGDKITAIAEHRHIEPEKLKRTLRGDLDWIVMRALEKDRNRRYDTANGFALDIQRYLNDEPVFAGPPSMRYKIGKFVSRNRKGVAAAAALLVVMLAATGVSLWQAARATLAQKQAEAARGDAEGLISYMLTDLKDNLAPVGRVDLMRGIGETVQDYYARQGGAQSGKTSQLRHAQALGVLASVEENTGSAEDADKLNKQCIHSIEGWMAAHGRTAEALRTLAEAHERQAQFYFWERWGRQADPELAAASRAEAVRLFAELCKTPDNTSEDRWRLLYAMLREARQLRAMRKREDVFKILDLAAKLIAVEEAKGSLTMQGRLAKELLLCEASWMSMPPDSLPAGWGGLLQEPAQVTMQPVRKLLREEPDNQQLREQVWQLISWSPRKVTFHGEEIMLRLSADISRELLELDPRNMLWADHAAWSLRNMAATLTGSQRKNEAEPYHKETIAILEGLVEKQPWNLALKERLCSALNGQGFHYLDKRELARASFQKALTVLEDIERQVSDEGSNSRYASNVEEQRIWLHLFMSQVMPTVDEQVRLLKEVTPLAQRLLAAWPRYDQAQLARYYVHGEAVRYLESARRYEEALRETASAIEVIESIRRTTGVADAMSHLWREIHQARARILLFMGRGKEAARDATLALEIAVKDLRGYQPSSSFSRFRVMSTALHALSLRLKVPPALDKATCTEFLDDLRLVVDGIKDTKAEPAETPRLLDELITIVASIAVVTGDQELPELTARAWALMQEAYENASASIPTEDPTWLDVRQCRARMLVDSSAFTSFALKQGSLPSLLLSEAAFWQKKCSDHPENADAWLHLGLYRLASSKISKGDIVEARAAFERATSLLLEIKATVNAAQIRSLKRLAPLWVELADVERAILVHREWIRRSKEMQGTEDYSTADAISSFISNLKRLGRIQDALVLSKELMEMRLSVYGPASHHVAVSLREIGGLQTQLKSIDEARKHIAESIALCRKLGEPELPDLASALVELGRLEKTAGNWEPALKLLAEGLELRKKLLSPEHNDVHNLTAELSTALWNSGTHKAEALRMREELIEFKRRQTNPGIWVDWLYEYAGWLRAEKDYPRAEAAIRETLERQSKVHASGHQPQMARKLLGVILNAQGKHDEAGPHLQAAFEGLAKLAAVLPSNHRTELASSMNYVIEHVKNSPGPPDRMTKWAAKAHELLLGGKNESILIPADALHRLASLWSELGQRDKAVETRRRQVEQARKSANENSTELVSALIELGRELNRDKQLEEARTAYHEAIQLRRKQPGSQVRSLDGYLHEAGLIANTLKKHDEAILLLHESLKIRQEAGEPEILNVATVIQALGNVYRDKGDYESAAAHYRQAIAIRKKNLGPKHREIASPARDLGGVLWKLNKHAEAIKTRAEAFECMRASGGMDSGWGHTLTEHAGWLYHQKRHAEFETTAREAVVLQSKLKPGGWEEAKARNYLGLALITLKRYDEAETEMLKAWEGLQKHEEIMPEGERYQVGTSLDRLIQLYKEWGKPEEMTKWSAVKTQRSAAKRKQ